MFRHKQTPATEVVVEEKNPIGEAVKDESSLKELIEKNLKWSQIIYEQNRKINNKLLWSAIADWLRLLVVAVPIILALAFLPAWLKNFWSQYGDLIIKSPIVSTKQNSLDNMLKLFNLDPAKQEQLKTLLK